MDDLRNELSNISGIKYEVIEETGGPPVGKDLEIRITGPTSDILVPVTKSLRDYIDNLDELISIEDTLPIPLVDWELTIDKPKAAQFGVDIFTIGTAIKLVTEGIMIGKYRPNDIDEELEIYVRYPESDRSIDQLDNVMIE